MDFTLNSMFGIKDRVIAVTGGCGGIGYGLCEAMAALGAKIAIVDFNAERTSAAAEELSKKYGVEARGYITNITQNDSVSDTFEKIYNDFGSLYGLVNCAGTSHVKFLSAMDIEDWQKVMDVNLRGTVLCTKYAGKYMEKSGVGRVINISSLASTHGKPGYTAYTPSKSAIDGFTFTLGAEWGRKNITVNAIAPVFVLTDINRSQYDDVDAAVRRMKDNNPQGKICSPELLSGLTVFLMSDSAEFVNGQVIGCDGGCTRGDIGGFKPEGFVPAT